MNAFVRDATRRVAPSVVRIDVDFRPDAIDRDLLPDPPGWAIVVRRGLTGFATARDAASSTTNAGASSSPTRTSSRVEDVFE